MPFRVTGMTADHVPPVVEEPRGSLFSNFIAIVGLIILIVVVIWGLAHLIGLSQGWFTSLFNRTPQIAITAPKEVTAGQPFNISWKYSTTEKGNYAFLYQCKNGLTLKNGDIPIPCGNSYTVGTASSLTFTPILEGTASAQMPLSIIFLPSATSSQKVQGSVTITVQKASTATSTPSTTSESPTPLPSPSTKPSTPSPRPTTPSPSPSPNQPVSRTPADLSVQILALGVIDRSTGMFVNRAPMYFDDIAAAQFDIANVGGSTSGTYYFSANLPAAGGYVYNSPAQTPLHPGDHVINTLRWTNSTQTGTFTVAVSGDSNAANNYASATIGQAGPPQPTYQYQQPQYNNYYTNPMYYQQYTY